MLQSSSPIIWESDDLAAIDAMLSLDLNSAVAIKAPSKGHYKREGAPIEEDSLHLTTQDDLLLANCQAGSIVQRVKWPEMEMISK